MPADREYSNFADLSVTAAVNLIGAASMTVEEFQAFRADPRPTLGMSLEVIAPTGDYSNNRFINTGANRWAIKPEFGFMYPLTSKLLLELEAGVWFYGDDDEYIGGNKLSDNQGNARLGGTLVKPLSRRQVIKLGYATGVRTQFGTDFDQFLLSYQLLLR